MCRCRREGVLLTMSEVPSLSLGPGPARRGVLARRIRLLVAVTITYNAVEAAVALTAGTTSSSTALVGFGLDSVIEVSSAAAVAWQFSARDHAVRDAREGTALRFIALSFFVLAAYVAVDAVRALTGTGEATRSLPCIVLAALPLDVMPFLSAAVLLLAVLPLRPPGRRPPVRSRMTRAVVATDLRRRPDRTLSAAVRAHPGQLDRVPDVREAGGLGDGVGPDLDRAGVDGPAQAAFGADEVVPVVGAWAVPEEAFAVGVADHVGPACLGQGGEGAVDRGQADRRAMGGEPVVERLGADEAFGLDERLDDDGALLGVAADQRDVGRGCGGVLSVAFHQRAFAHVPVGTALRVRGPVAGRRIRNVAA